jgi:DNA polymerase-4
MAAYVAVSHLVTTALNERAELVESAGVDEAYLIPRISDFSDSSAILSWAEALRADIRDLVGIPLSIGVASTKVLAKIASERAKPDGVFIVTPEEELDFLAAQPVRALPGVGPVTDKVLNDSEIRLVADIRQRNRNQMISMLGSTGGVLWDLAHNRDIRQVMAGRPSSQISVEKTYEHDLAAQDVPKAIIALAEELSQRLSDSGVGGATVSMKMRKSDLSTFTRSTTLSSPVNQPDELARLGTYLYDRSGWSGPLRLLGLGVSGLTTTEQLDLHLDIPGTSTESDEITNQRSNAQEESAVPVHHDPPREQIIDRIHWGMRLSHRTFGVGRVEGLDGNVVAIRFATGLKLFDLEIVDLAETF